MMKEMLEDLTAKGYRVFKWCKVTPAPEIVGFTSNYIEKDPNVVFNKATIYIPGLGPFSTTSRNRMIDAIRGAALNLKKYLKDANLGDYNLQTYSVDSRDSLIPPEYYGKFMWLHNVLAKVSFSPVG